MKLKKIIIITVITCCLSTHAQQPDRWNAQWITHPTIAVTEHAVVLFRKSFDLSVIPKKFIIHISADNHYRLYVNGQYITRGPARGDRHHWFYETLDIAQYLKSGKNSLAAEVVNWGPKRSFTYFSQMTSFIVQGNSTTEAIVNTVGGAWKCFHNQAYKAEEVDWIFDRSTIDFGLYVGNPTDHIDGSKYPWDWEKTVFDDSAWASSKWADISGTRNEQYAGGILFGDGKTLIPRRTGLLHECKEELGKVVRTSGINHDDKFLRGTGALQIEANKKVSLLIDQSYETIGYPEMLLSGGKGARVQVMYAENLIYKNKSEKLDRSNIENKYLVGIKDTYYPDGSSNRLYRPLYLRAFRFVQLDIETGAEPLTINNFYNILCTAPIELKGKFETDNADLNALMPMGWRTASICAQDMLMSDAAYEQMQYTGDSRVHNLTLLALSGDDRLTRNSLIQFDESRIPEGLTYACYPNAFHLIIPSYSLIWIDQVYDYMMWKDDRAFIKQFELGIKNVLHWYEQRLQPNGLLGPIEWWPALAWPRHYENGVPPGINKGGNTLYSLHYAYTLRHAAEIFKYLEKETESNRFRKQADAIGAAVNKHCKRADGLYKESPTLDSISQITNIMAALAGATNTKESKQLMLKLTESKDWFGQVDLFLHLYLFEALNKTNLQEKFVDELSEWMLMKKRNLSTFAEVPLEWGEETQRSECHPWSTSPNYFFFRTLCGIEPLTAGHKSVIIKPYLGDLKFVKATYPHHLGNIMLDIQSEGSSIKGTVTIPAGIQATFQWQGKKQVLKPGINAIQL